MPTQALRFTLPPAESRLRFRASFTVEMPSAIRDNLVGAHTNVGYQICLAIDVATFTDTV